MSGLAAFNNIVWGLRIDRYHFRYLILITGFIKRVLEHWLSRGSILMHLHWGDCFLSCFCISLWIQLAWSLYRIHIRSCSSPLDIDSLNFDRVWCYTTSDRHRYKELNISQQFWCTSAPEWSQSAVSLSLDLFLAVLIYVDSFQQATLVLSSWSQLEIQTLGNFLHFHHLKFEKDQER